jgi:hypothetical protein
MTRETWACMAGGTMSLLPLILILVFPGSFWRFASWCPIWLWIPGVALYGYVGLSITLHNVRV